MITTWWLSLTLSMRVLWGVTLSASLIFVIQTILTFIGFDAGDSDFDAPLETDFNPDADATFEADPGMNLLTFRNFVNFFLGFGWSAILLQDSISSTPLLLIVSCLVGVALVAVIMLLFKWVSSMQQSGNINVYKSAVGCQGTVYLPIPAGRQGVGKVQITINNSVREYDALTDGEALRTGDNITVKEVINMSTVLVELK